MNEIAAITAATVHREPWTREPADRARRHRRRALDIQRAARRAGRRRR